MSYTQRPYDIRAREAFYSNNLKFFLLPWITSRVCIRFNDKKTSQHLFALEHTSTLKQVINNRVEYIELNPAKGLELMIHMLEVSYKGKYKSAVIYQRPQGEKDFTHKFREYNERGELIYEDASDQITMLPQKLYYHGLKRIENSALEELDLRLEALPDFNSEIAKNLQHEVNV